MEVHGSLNLLGNEVTNVTIASVTNFPADPKPGRFLFKDKILYVCAEVDQGIPVWVPLTKTLNMLKYTQSVPALEWTINHNLNCSNVLVQVYDLDGNVVIPDNINCGTFNQVHISFNMPVGGIAILQRGDEDGLEPISYSFEASFNGQTEWVVNHGLGYNPIVRAFIGVNEVQPESIVFNTLNQLTVTFSSPQSGVVRCI